MTLPAGFNVRNTLAFVTDVSPDTFANATTDAYPVSYPNGITGGWEQATGTNQARDRTTGNPRLAGFGENSTNTDTTFRIDLPTPGNYAIQLGAGDSSYAVNEAIEIFDTTTSLVSYSISTGAANSYMDATGAILTHTAWAAGTNSRGGVLTKSFATTILRFTQHSVVTTTASPIAHVFVAAAAGGAALAGAASDTTTASGALTTGGPAPFAPIVLDNAGHAGGSDQIGLGSGPNTGTGDAANLAFTKLKQWAADANSMMAQLYGTRSVQTPTTGFTIAAAAGVTQLVLNPAGTLATGTVTFPPNPGDNQPFSLMTSQTITALTANTSDGNSINGAPTTLSANTAVRWRFITSLSKWFREQ